MIMLTKEQLADLLREAYQGGWDDHMETQGSQSVDLAYFMCMQERAIQPLVHRSSGGHDDHGREVLESARGPHGEDAKPSVSFAAWLIDHREGQVVTEEDMHEWLGEWYEQRLAKRADGEDLQ